MSISTALPLVNVTKEQFWAFIMTAPYDIHPRCEKMENLWELRDRTVIGRTTPGWKCDGEKSWQLTEGRAAEARALLQKKAPA